MEFRQFVGHEFDTVLHAAMTNLRDGDLGWYRSDGNPRRHEEHGPERYQVNPGELFSSL